MAEQQVIEAWGGAIQLWLTYIPASGQFYDVTQVRCRNASPYDCTFRFVSNSTGAVLAERRYAKDSDTTDPVSPAPRVRLTEEGVPDLGNASIRFTIHFSG